MTLKRSKPAPPPHNETFSNPRPYAIEIAVAGLPRMPNALLGAHWTIRAGHAKKWLRAVGLAIQLNGKLPPAPLKRAEIWCVRKSSGKCDDEGLRGSFKAPVDALVKLKVIEDDSPDHVLIHYAHEKAAPGKGSIFMRIEEREGA